MRSLIHSAPRFALSLLLTVALAASTPAFAAAPRGPSPVAIAKAKAKFNEGKKAYDLGQFEAALSAYSDAYQHAALPGLLFNIAQCHRQLGNYERAAFFYRRYLDLEAKPRDAATVRELIAEMEKRQEAKSREEQTARELELAKLSVAKAELDASRPSAPAQATPSAQLATPASDLKASAPVTRQWWFWTAVGVVAAGGLAVGGYYAFRPRPLTPSLGESNQR